MDCSMYLPTYVTCIAWWLYHMPSSLHHLYSWLLSYHPSAFTLHHSHTILYQQRCNMWNHSTILFPSTIHYTPIYHLAPFIIYHVSCMHHLLCIHSLSLLLSCLSSTCMNIASLSSLIPTYCSLTLSHLLLNLNAQWFGLLQYSSAHITATYWQFYHAPSNIHCLPFLVMDAVPSLMSHVLSHIIITTTLCSCTQNYQP